MGISVVDIGVTAVPGFTNATVTVGAGGIPSGALIVVCTVEDGGSAGSVTDSAGNSYNTAVFTAFNSLGAGLCIFYCYNAIAISPGGTIEYNRHSLGAHAIIAAFYATGVQAGSDPRDSATVASATGSSATPTVVSGAPTAAGELFVALVGTPSSSLTFTQDTTHASWSTPPDEGINSGGGNRIDGANVVTSGESAVQYAPSYSGSTAWGALIVGFKASVALIPVVANDDQTANIIAANRPVMIAY